eukprot:1630797-Prymnesium_polylepis.2
MAAAPTGSQVSWENATTAAGRASSVASLSRRTLIAGQPTSPETSRLVSPRCTTLAKKESAAFVMVAEASASCSERNSTTSEASLVACARTA